MSQLQTPMRLGAALGLCAAALTACTTTPEPASPYGDVDWSTVSHYRADLHVHTLQSDGCHGLDEVADVFHDAGFAILAITDHDAVSPNRCPPRAAASAAQIEFGVFAEPPSPYPDPVPAGFPANPTWPWSAFGAPLPEDLGMVGIEAAELTCGHHMSSLFNDYGVAPPCEEAPSEQAQLAEVGRRGGLAFVNHPARSAADRGLDWYLRLYAEPSAGHIVGLEVSGDGAVDVNAALWDQLLAELMPDRPIWAFGTSDMHLLVSTRFAFTVFLLDALDADSVKAAMRSGRFYAVVGPSELNLSRDRGPAPHDGASAYDGTYPGLRSITVDRNAGAISIDATGYDEVVWISAPASSEPSADPDAALPWPGGEIVGRGPVFDYASLDPAVSYVRAELVRHTDAGPIRLFLNPIGLTPR